MLGVLYFLVDECLSVPTQWKELPHKSRVVYSMGLFVDQYIEE